MINPEVNVPSGETQVVVRETQNRCYTVQDLQVILGVSRSSIYHLLQRKEFKWIKIGTGYRIPRKGFDAWLESQD